MRYEVAVRPNFDSSPPQVHCLLRANRQMLVVWMTMLQGVVCRKVFQICSWILLRLRLSFSILRLSLSPGIHRKGCLSQNQVSLNCTKTRLRSSQEADLVQRVVIYLPHAMAFGEFNSAVSSILSSRNGVSPDSANLTKS